MAAFDLKNNLIIIGGPTASGKTSLSIALAQSLKCPILSSDSRQFYKEMSIGTAKPTREELEKAEHHFISHLSIHDDYSAGDYERDAIELLQDIYKDSNTAILVGGTGLFVKAVSEGLDDFPNVPDSVREKWISTVDSEGLAPLQKELQLKDPDYFQKIDTSNPQRLVRALSVIEVSGKSYSSFLGKEKSKRPFRTIKIAIIPDRNKLYQRINQRVDEMIGDGLIEEARSLYPHRQLNALQTVGYKELFQYFDGEWTLEQAIDKIKQHTRNYAKRQMTWFRNQGEWHLKEEWTVEEILAAL